MYVHVISNNFHLENGYNNEKKKQNKIQNDPTFLLQKG